jgi:hypothetical protein
LTPGFLLLPDWLPSKSKRLSYWLDFAKLFLSQDQGHYYNVRNLELLFVWVQLQQNGCGPLRSRPPKVKSQNGLNRALTTILSRRSVIKAT